MAKSKSNRKKKKNRANNSKQAKARAVKRAELDRKEGMRYLLIFGGITIAIVVILFLVYTNS